MSDIKITGTQGWDDCETCGSYDWEKFTVTVDGREVLNHAGDSHLGGGTWYSWEAAVSDILGALGHTVTIDIGDAA